MNWIKKSGITLLTFLSLGFAMPSNAMSLFETPRKLDALTEALKKLNIDQKTIEELIKIIERLEKSGLEVIAQLNTTLNETIQGSSELKSLGDIQRNIETLINKEIPEYKAKSIGTSSAKSDKENKRAVASESESKEQASRATQLSLTPEPTQLDRDRKFIATTIEPVITTIDATLKELRANIQQRITAYTAEQRKLSESQKKEHREQDAKIKEASQKTSTLSSLEEKKASLSKIKAQLRIIRDLVSPPMPVPPGTSILNQIAAELTELNKVVNTEIVNFKGGLAGVLDDTIKSLTDGLSNTGKTISTNISEDLQRNLRAAIGSSEIIKSIEDINNWLITYKDTRNRINKEFIIKITEYIGQLEDSISGLQFYHTPQALFEILGKFRSALARYQEAIKHDASDGKQTFAANEALYQAICRANFELLDCVQGTLASLINVLKKNLLDVVNRFNEGFGHTITQLNNNIDKNVKQFHSELRTTVNKDLPRTLKKGIGYLTLGTFAACAVCHIIWHDRPWQGHLKSIGIAAGSIISMFFVDPIVDYFYRPSRIVPAAE